MTEQQPCRVLLVRHGEVAADGSLSEAGRSGVRLLAQLLRDVPIDALFSAEVPAARETTAELGRDRAVEPVVDRALDPVDAGEGETFDEAIAGFLSIVKAWQDRTIVIVSDAAVIQALLCRITAAAVAHHRRFVVAPASVIVAEVEESGKGVLHVLNWDRDVTQGVAADQRLHDEPAGVARTTCRVYLVRHGQAMTVEEGGQVWSHHPVSLTAKGQEQARRASEMLADVKFDAIYASNLDRARETAEVVAAAHGLEPIVEPGLLEISIGRFEGLTLTELYAEGDDRFLPWLEVTFHQRFASEEFHHPSDLVFPEGESIDMVHARTLAVFQRIVGAHLGQTIGIVSHTWVMQPLICRLTGGDARNYFRYGLRYATVNLAEVDADGLGMLEILNGGQELDDIAGGRLTGVASGEARH